jgi:beta-N-acetylhexosaminidase
MAVRAFIAGVSGTALTADERAFLREAEPWGLILFKRNVESPAQALRLTASLREAVGRDAPILVDQEGGRVQRLGPPHWPPYPAGMAYGRAYERSHERGLRAAWIGARLIAADLAAVGIDVDCLPVADVPVAGANEIIGERAYGTTPVQVSRLAQAAADGLSAGGVLPVLKHIPGHGRANVDSHGALPTVGTDRATLEGTDFAAFRPLAGLPLAMTAHVVFSAIDPIAPATTSATLVGQVIRGWIGFGGLLMTDDISMGALDGPIAARSRAAIAAGCDVILHCNGKLDEMREVAEAAPVLAGDAAVRATAALALRGKGSTEDLPALRRELANLLDERNAQRMATS